MKIFRLLLAFCISPIIPALIIALFLSVFVKNSGLLHLANIFMAIGSYGLMIVIGIPLYIYLERKKLENIEAYILSGALGGIIVPLLMSIKHAGKSDNGSIMLIMIGLTYGSLLGLAFWLIAKKNYNHSDLN